ncbi:deoxynucleoside kinase [Micavibrio aeruginosavorus]|uniref:Deoxynucleoside kinase domain-containing protein n=1 Tax=Micavibrio aeruginosavorus (strain ARL-13) TaxID=856793 RepID=G2KSM3_MICAA|nr:deoxynucleoside kinase [Micavibrio aeruginosavorus]AEP09623.1 hypothetical protein MICA_1301 [Micavibrio aeruginosavorus ARL-13]
MGRRIEMSGILAAGKSTLCDIFARNGFTIGRENVQDNPYWAKVQVDPKTYEPLLQEWILKQRFNEVARSESAGATPLQMIDFCLAVDKAYADFYMAESAPEKMRKTHDAIDNMYATYGDPALIVHLHCDSTELIRRIEKRGRFFEQSHTVEFLDSLNGKICHYLDRVKSKGTIPVLEFDMTHGGPKIDQKFINKIKKYCPQ